MQSVSIIIPTFNSIRVIENCLKSIRNQDYNGKIEVLIADGGSNDGTIEMAKKFNGKIIKENTGSPEKAKAIALKQAKSDLILFMSGDNVLPTKDWLKIMVESLEKEQEAVASYSWRYEWRKDDISLNRYFALMGVNDPVAWFMNKADKQEWGSQKWKLSGNVKDKDKYWLVEFNEKSMGTLGDNGFLIKRNRLMKAKIGVDNFFHIDVVLDLVKMGENKFVVVKNNIFHDTGEKYFRFLKKRYKYMKNLYLDQKQFRRFVWVKNWKDLIKVFGYIVYSLTLIGSMYQSIKGYAKKPDLAWFWHPIMCFSMVFVYGFAIFTKVEPLLKKQEKL